MLRTELAPTIFLPSTAAVNLGVTFTQQEGYPYAMKQTVYLQHVRLACIRIYYKLVFVLHLLTCMEY